MKLQTVLKSLCLVAIVLASVLLCYRVTIAMRLDVDGLVPLCETGEIQLARNGIQLGEQSS